jgi:hypothetical protein
MSEAVELICRHQAIILVIEEFKEGCQVEEGLPLTGREYRDLSRARSYLRETAKRHDVEVFLTIKNAIESIAKHLDR